MNSWANSGLDLQLSLDRRHLRDSLERGLRDAIGDGRLAPGAAVPPSRALAADLGVARNTVAEAYSQLVAEGWLVARAGSGTRVAPRSAVAPFARRPWAPQAALRYDLRAGSPDLSSFPRTQWLAASRAALAGAPAESLGYSPAAGVPEVRTSLAAYLGRARGVHVDPTRLILCGGFTGGLHVIASTLYGLGARRVGVEQFGHNLHRAVLADAGLRPVPLPVDAEGAVADRLDDLDAVLLTAAHQFPLGAALSARRRAGFTAWAARTGGVVIDDDYDGEFRYDRRALGAMQAQARDDVIYAGTASKTLAPGLRIGWLVVPDRLLGPVLERHELGESRAGVIEQLTLARFIETGRYDRHVRRARLVYRRRRDHLLAALERGAPHARPTGTSAGLHVTLTLADDAPAGEVVRRARAEGLELQALDDFAADAGASRNGLVVGYATPPPHLYPAAVTRLVAALAGG